jgi:c(7)-type cytochrome triheme protein
MSIRNVLLLLSFFILLTPADGTPSRFDLPPLPPADIYGNILISRVSIKKGVFPVTFSHWSHRLKYTCNVCHLELGFNMMRNTTEITEDSNRNGEYCGACHDGAVAFGHSREHCEKCHNSDIEYGKEKFANTRDLPRAPYGNRIDWVSAVEDGLIKPKFFLQDETEPIKFEKQLLLEAEWSMIPSAIFPHKAHVQWLDCSNCHPDIFNIKKKTTKHFSMMYILDNKFCGVCHGKVAFPIDDCARCHPDMRR